MRCPILPVGPGVTTTLPVRADIVQKIREGLSARGYGVPSTNQYTPELAQQLYGFQRDHPLEVPGDLAVSLGVRGPNGGALGIAGCQTYAALGIPCDAVDCVASLWEPFVGGYAQALALCGVIHAAADAGTVSLTCPTVAPPPSPQPPGGQEVEDNSGTLILVGVAALLFLALRGRR